MRSRARWKRGAPLAALLILSGFLAMTSTAAAAVATHGRNSARANSSPARAAAPTPWRLMAAAAAARRADRLLVADARRLRRCSLMHHGHARRCGGTHLALQRAGTRLERAQRRLSQLAGRRRHARLSRLVPHIWISGQTLEWARVVGFTAYVVDRKAPAQPDQYYVVHGTSTTPPPLPGATVRYSVRTAARRSPWSAEVTISYPPASSHPPVRDRRTAPTLSVNGQVLSWNAIPGVGAYVLVTKAPGKADHYSEVSATSTTPPQVPGATVHYSVRTAVEGSAWSSEVAISYPSVPPGGSEPEKPAPEETPRTSHSFEPGVDSGTNMGGDLQAASLLGAKLVRVEWPVGTTASEMRP